MHTLVRRYLKTAVAFLAAGLAIGLWLVVRRELWGVWPTSHLVSAHAHAILVGFVMLLIQGVALWMFPRPEKGDTRYDPRRVEAAFWLVATGTGARVGAEVLRGALASDAAPFRWAIVLGSAAQAAGLLLFFHPMWTRIRPVGSAQREARGERF